MLFFGITIGAILGIKYTVVETCHLSRDKIASAFSSQHSLGEEQELGQEMEFEIVHQEEHSIHERDIKALTLQKEESKEPMNEIN
jgi:hypothetical protein